MYAKHHAGIWVIRTGLHIDLLPSNNCALIHVPEVNVTAGHSNIKPLSAGG